MAVRREHDRGMDNIDSHGEATLPLIPAAELGQAENGVYGALHTPGVVRPEVLASARQVIEEDRGLLERLAAYDRGETSER